MRPDEVADELSGAVIDPDGNDPNESWSPAELRKDMDQMAKDLVDPHKHFGSGPVQRAAALWRQMPRAMRDRECLRLLREWAPRVAA